MEIKCPYCKNHQDHDDDILPYEDGETKNLDCHNCDNSFVVRCFATVSHEIEKMEDV